MRKNPFLKAEKAIIKKVYGNRVTLNINIRQRIYDNATGTFQDVTATYPCAIHIGNPHEIADAIVDKMQYVKGDLNVDVAFKEIIDAKIPKNGFWVTIANFRNSNRNAGLDETKDTLTFDGTTYRIVKITPKNIYAGIPTKLKLQLRAV